MTSEQVSEWQAYDKLEPIGGWVADFRLAKLCSLLVNLVKQVWGKKGTYEWSSPKEFMPNWSGAVAEEESQSVDEMKQVLMNIASTKKKKSGMGVSSPPKKKRK